MFESLKKRRQGVYRAVPVPPAVNAEFSPLRSFSAVDRFNIMPIGTVDADLTAMAAGG